MKKMIPIPKDALFYISTGEYSDYCVTGVFRALQEIDADSLLARAERLGARFRERLAALQARCPSIQEVRVKGAMIGIELSTDGTPIVSQCLERKLLINCTHGTVLRLLPAMNLTDAQMEEGCDILEAVLLANKG